MARRLTRLDELPRHQIGQTFDVVADGSPHGATATTSRWATTTGRGPGSWASGCTPTTTSSTCSRACRGPVASTTSAGRAGLRPRIDDLDCGPVSVEVVEGCGRCAFAARRTSPARPTTSRSTGWSPVYNEDHVQVFVNGRLNSDRSNYDQCSTVHGWFEVAGERVEVDGWTGVRDHSWGIGNHTGGPRSASIAPPPDVPAPPGLRQWCVVPAPGPGRVLAVPPRWRRRRPVQVREPVHVPLRRRADAVRLHAPSTTT